MAPGNARRKLRDNPVMPVLFGCRCCDNASSMAQGTQRPPVVPRFYSTEALHWCVVLVVVASIARATTLSTRWTQAAALMAAIAIVAVSVSAQLALVPKAREAYLFRPTSPYSSSERQEADAVFARYRLEGKPEEPHCVNHAFSVRARSKSLLAGSTVWQAYTDLDSRW